MKVKKVIVVKREQKDNNIVTNNGKLTIKSNFDSVLL